MNSNQNMIFCITIVVIYLANRHVFAAASGCRAMIDGKPKLPNTNLSASSTHWSVNLADIRFSDLQGWAAGVNRVGEYVQVDAGLILVTAVATKGRGAAHILQWVTKYQLSFSINGVDWNRLVEIFDGNSDRDTIVKHTLTRPQFARYVRLYPLAWSGHMSMRWEVYGCQVTIQPMNVTMMKAEAHSVTVTWADIAAGLPTQPSRCYSNKVELINATFVYEGQICFLSTSPPRLTISDLEPSTNYRLSLSPIVQGHTFPGATVLVITTTSQAPQTSGTDDKHNLAIVVGVVGGLIFLGNTY